MLTLAKNRRGLSFLIELKKLGHVNDVGTIIETVTLSHFI